MNNLLGLVLMFLAVQMLQGFKDPAGEYGIKLCGRDFIRTVIMSCGGSRWKRYSQEMGQERVNPYRELLEWLNSDHFYLDTKEEMESVEDSDSKRTTPSFEPYKDLTGLEEDPDNNEKGDYMNPLLQGGNSRHSRVSRTKRNLGPAGACCQWGCTKSELAQFC